MNDQASDLNAFSGLNTRWCFWMIESCMGTVYVEKMSAYLPVIYGAVGTRPTFAHAIRFAIPNLDHRHLVHLLIFEIVPSLFVRVRKGHGLPTQFILALEKITRMHIGRLGRLVIHRCQWPVSNRTVQWSPNTFQVSRSAYRIRK